MKKSREASNRSRIVRLTAVLLLTTLVFGSMIGGVSAAKFNGNVSIATGLLTPAAGAVSNSNSVAPVPTEVPTNVAVSSTTINIAPTPTAESTVIGLRPTDVVNSTVKDGSGGGTDSGQTNPYNFVYFDLFVCPKGYAGTTDGSQAAADCMTRATNVSMHLINGDGDHAQTVSSSVSWGYLRPGPITVRQDVGSFQKQPLVFCRGVNGAFVQQSVNDGAINETVGVNTELYCAWYITPKRLPTDGVVATVTGVFTDGANNPPPASGSLYINGIGCPAGFDAASVDIYGLALNCHDDGPNSIWYVTDGQLVSQSVSGSDASFSNLAPGSALTGYLIPPSFGNPRVFCKSQQGDAETEVSVSNGFFHVNVLSGQDAYCDVFSIQAAPATGASVISDTNTCTESDVNGDFSHPNLANNCSTYLNDVYVTASANGQQVGYATTLTGVAQMNGLPVGDVQIAAESASVLPSDLVVYCNISGVGDDHQVQVYGSQIDLNLTDGETVNCSWFFISGGPLVGSSPNGGDAAL